MHAVLHGSCFQCLECCSNLECPAQVKGVDEASKLLPAFEKAIPKRVEADKSGVLVFLGTTEIGKALPCCDQFLASFVNCFSSAGLCGPLAQAQAWSFSLYPFLQCMPSLLCPLHQWASAPH